MVAFDVLFIGGAPGSGKSTLGRAIASDLGYGSMTGDDLAIAVRLVSDPEEHPGLDLTKGVDHTTYFTDGPAGKLIADAGAQDDAMWPILERVSASHLQSGAGVVIDWWLLSPHRVAAMGDDRVASLWLYIDPDVLWERERKNTNFLADSPDPEKMLNNFMARSLWRNDLVAREAARHGLPLLTVTNQTVEQLVAEALDLLH